MYDVVLDNQPKDFLRKSPFILSERITKKLQELRIQPTLGAKRVRGTPSQWRIRIGDYRALYIVNHQTQTVFVSRIDHRSRVYDRIT